MEPSNVSAGATVMSEDSALATPVTPGIGAWGDEVPEHYVPLNGGMVTPDGEQTAAVKSPLTGGGAPSPVVHRDESVVRHVSLNELKRDMRRVYQFMHLDEDSQFAATLSVKDVIKALQKVKVSFFNKSTREHSTQPRYSNAYIFNLTLPDAVRLLTALRQLSRIPRPPPNMGGGGEDPHRADRGRAEKTLKQAEWAITFKTHITTYGELIEMDDEFMLSLLTEEERTYGIPEERQPLIEFLRSCTPEELSRVKCGGYDSYKIINEEFYGCMDDEGLVAKEETIKIYQTDENGTVYNEDGEPVIIHEHDYPLVRTYSYGKEDGPYTTTVGRVIAYCSATPRIHLVPGYKPRCICNRNADAALAKQLGFSHYCCTPFETTYHRKPREYFSAFPFTHDELDEWEAREGLAEIAKECISQPTEMWYSGLWPKTLTVENAAPLSPSVEDVIEESPSPAPVYVRDPFKTNCYLLFMGHVVVFMGHLLPVRMSRPKVNVAPAPQPTVTGLEDSGETADASVAVAAPRDEGLSAVVVVDVAPRDEGPSAVVATAVAAPRKRPATYAAAAAVPVDPRSNKSSLSTKPSKSTKPKTHCPAPGQSTDGLRGGGAGGSNDLTSDAAAGPVKDFRTLLGKPSKEKHQSFEAWSAGRKGVYTNGKMSARYNGGDVIVSELGPLVQLRLTNFYEVRGKRYFSRYDACDIVSRLTAVVDVYRPGNDAPFVIVTIPREYNGRTCDEVLATLRASPKLDGRVLHWDPYE